MTVARILIGIAFAAAIAVWAGSSHWQDKDAKDAEPKDIFAKDFRPILEKYCYRCHGEETQKGDLNFAEYKRTADVDMAGDVFNLVVARPRAAEMPPPGPKQLTLHEGQDFRNWIDSRPFAKLRDCNTIAGDNSQNNYRGTSRSWTASAGGHHDISHHSKRESKIDQYQRINRWHVGQFTYLCEKLRSIKEGDGTLLDNSLVLLGSSLADGNGHEPNNLPILLGGSVQSGRHIASAKNTPLCNLYVSLLDGMGTPVKSFGDSTGPLPIG